MGERVKMAEMVHSNGCCSIMFYTNLIHHLASSHFFIFWEGVLPSPQTSPLFCIQYIRNNQSKKWIIPTIFTLDKMSFGVGVCILVRSN